MAGLSCSEHLLRIFFVIFNLVFFLIGLLLVGSAIYALASSGDYKEFDISYLTSVSAILLCIGVVIFVVGFLGCCGAFKKNHWMMYIYAIAILILLCLEIAAGIYALVNLDDAEEILRDSMEPTLDDYVPDSGTAKAWDKVQEKAECCGSTGPSSWTDHSGFTATSVPDSCCKTVAADCGQNYNSADVYTEGCAKAVKDDIEASLFILGLIGIIGALLHLVGILVACCLGNAFKEYQEVDGQDYRTT